SLLPLKGGCRPACRVISSGEGVRLDCACIMRQSAASGTRAFPGPDQRLQPSASVILNHGDMFRTNNARKRFIYLTGVHRTILPAPEIAPLRVSLSMNEPAGCVAPDQAGDQNSGNQAGNENGMLFSHCCLLLVCRECLRLTAEHLVSTRAINPPLMESASRSATPENQ